MSVCPVCRLPQCACRSGKTTITAAGATVGDAKAIADGYLERRDWRGTVIQVQRQRAHIGVIGYRAWRFTYRVTRP